MKYADTNSPEAKMLNAMYGNGFDYHWAVVDGLWVCRISGDPNAIHGLIDQVKAGPPAKICSEMQSALAVIPDANNMDMVATYNYLRLFRMMAAIMPAPMSQINVPSRSNLAIAAKIRNGGATLDIGIPKKHLQEIMLGFQMMMEMQMQQQMKQNPQGQQFQMTPVTPVKPENK
jgi:hypothetical protein